MLPSQGSPYVRMTKSTYRNRQNYNNNNQQGRDKRSNLLGDIDDGDNNSQQQQQQSSPQRQQYPHQYPYMPASDPSFVLVPSSSASQASGNNANTAANANANVGGANNNVNGNSPMGSGSRTMPVTRRPPPPTAANTTVASSPQQAGSSGRNAKFSLPSGPGGRNIDWKEEMKRFYIAIGLPEKIAGISTILNTWAGKEEQMLASLMEKYKESIPPQLNAHLELILSHLETHTESSFVKGPAVSGASGTPKGDPRSRSPAAPRNARRNNRPSPVRANL